MITKYLFLGIVGLFGITNVQASMVTLFGTGSATTDGVLSEQEWNSAGIFDFSVNTPGGGTTDARLLVMNDFYNIYFGLDFVRDVADAGNSFVIEFDSDNSGTLNEGDDGIIVNPSVGFNDLYRSSDFGCPQNALCSFRDTEIGGTNDGSGAFANDGTKTIYEMSHPLDSGDILDYSLAPGDTIGLSLFVRTLSSGSVWPDDFGDTAIPFGVVEFDVSVVPIPAAAWLFGTALVGLVGISKSRKAA